MVLSIKRPWESMFNDCLMIFRGWLIRGFGARWRPMAACGGITGIPQTPYPYFPVIRCFDGSIVRFLDAGGWLELSAGDWLMLSQLQWPLCMLVQKGCWLASMLCLGSHTLDASALRRTAAVRLRHDVAEVTTEALATKQNHNIIIHRHCC